MAEVWTEKETVLLKQNAATASPARIARALNRTEAAVRTKMSQLGLKPKKGCAAKPYEAGSWQRLVDAARKHFGLKKER